MFLMIENLNPEDEQKNVAAIRKQQHLRHHKHLQQLEFYHHPQACISPPPLQSPAGARSASLV